MDNKKDLLLDRFTRFETKMKAAGFKAGGTDNTYSRLLNRAIDYENALLGIYGSLNGKEWNSDTTAEIAEIMVGLFGPFKDVGLDDD